MKSASVNYQKSRFSCYYTYLSMASVFALPPILFVTFREMYHISYTLLGSLVLINFCTQLGIDLIFTFFTKYFNVRKTVIIMPLLTSAGLFTYAIIPSVFPGLAYLGLVIGTFIFSVSAGLCEVLMSPLIAAIPSEHPDKDMSMLHSLYAWGVLSVVIISTAFLNLFGRENWMYLTGFFALLPLIASYLFATSPIPDMDFSSDSTSSKGKHTNIILSLCVLSIFLGSAAENTMSNWISGYMENALHIPKTIGDIFGMALFAVLLGLVRTGYAKYGKNITTFLLCSMTGAAICYLVIGLCNNVAVSFVACIMTGCFTSMLWPGTLIMMEEKIPRAGVAAYALMAAAGDFGASLAPQLMGIIIDKVSISDWAIQKSLSSSLTVDQISMRIGMFTASVFPILGIMVLIYAKKFFKKHEVS